MIQTAGSSSVTRIHFRCVNSVINPLKMRGHKPHDWQIVPYHFGLRLTQWVNEAFCGFSILAAMSTAPAATTRLRMFNGQWTGCRYKTCRCLRSYCRAHWSCPCCSENEAERNPLARRHFCRRQFPALCTRRWSCRYKSRTSRSWAARLARGGGCGCGCGCGAGILWVLPSLVWNSRSGSAEWGPGRAWRPAARWGRPVSTAAHGFRSCCLAARAAGGRVSTRSFWWPCSETLWCPRALAACYFCVLCMLSGRPYSGVSFSGAPRCQSQCSRPRPRTRTRRGVGGVSSFSGQLGAGALEAASSSWTHGSWTWGRDCFPWTPWVWSGATPLRVCDGLLGLIWVGSRRSPRML